MASEVSRGKVALIGVVIAIVGLVAIMFAINREPVPEVVIAEPKIVIDQEKAYAYGQEAWIFGYPLVLMDVTREVLTAAPAPDPEGTAAPINQLAKMPHHVSPNFKNVARVSPDSLRTVAWVDLENEPMILSLPETEGRYKLFSLMNMWTDVFGSIGTRTAGAAGGYYLIAGLSWVGKVPEEISETYRSSTRYAWILGQMQVKGPDDLAVPRVLQGLCTLTPLSAWGKDYTPPSNVPVDAKINTKETPPKQVAAMDAGTFFNRLAMAMKDNPLYPGDGPMRAKLRSLGIEPGKQFDINKVDPDIAKGLIRAVKEAQVKVSESVPKMKSVNGWIQPRNLGRYSADYETRSGIAMACPGADLEQDVMYSIAFVDGDGKPLDSANRYVMHYEKDGFTPTNATWSISLYQGPHFAPNALNRYYIAPWMPLKFNPDGSLDLYIQTTPPGPDKDANWLPAPATGEFNVVIRNYWPKKPALDGVYKNPPIKKVN